MSTFHGYPLLSAACDIARRTGDCVLAHYLGHAAVDGAAGSIAGDTAYGPAAALSVGHRDAEAYARAALRMLTPATPVVSDMCLHDDATLHETACSMALQSDTFWTLATQHGNESITRRAPEHGVMHRAPYPHTYFDVSALSIRIGLAVKHHPVIGIFYDPSSGLLHAGIDAHPHDTALFPAFAYAFSQRHDDAPQPCALPYSVLKAMIAMPQMQRKISHAWQSVPVRAIAAAMENATTAVPPVFFHDAPLPLDADTVPPPVSTRSAGRSNPRPPQAHENRLRAYPLHAHMRRVFRLPMRPRSETSAPPRAPYLIYP